MKQCLGKKNAEKAEKLCACLKGLAHPARISVLMLLKDGDKTVTELLSMIADISQSNLSQHLAFMKQCELIECRKDGPHVFYSLSKSKLSKIINALNSLCAK